MGVLLRAAAQLLGGALLLLTILAGPARAQTCFFTDDYTDPTRWTQLNSGIEVSGGGVQVTNTSGGSVPQVQRGIFQPLPQLLPDGGGWRLDLEMSYGNVGLSGGLLVVAVAAGAQHPLNIFPGGTQTITPQDCIGIITTGIPGARPVPLSLFVSDNGSWNQSTPLDLRLNAVSYLRLERLITGLLKMSSFEDAARTIHQPGSPVCYLPPGQYTSLNTVWHANLPQGSNQRNDQATLDNLCLSTIPVLDTAFTAQASRTRICLGQSVTLTAPNDEYAPVNWTTTDPNGAIFVATGPSVTYPPPVAGIYIFTASSVLARFCNVPRARSFTVEVVTPDVASVAYAASAFCRTGTADVTSFTPAGGTYRGTPGLVINATTGQLNLAASTVGPHTVTYTSTGFCPDSATFPLTIRPLNVTTLTYPATAFCRTVLQPAPVVQPAGGTFSGTPGLVVNATTGVLNLAASLPGTYVVTYTSAGPCPTSASFALRIDPLDVAAVNYAQAAYCRTGSTTPPVVSPVGGTFSGTAGLVLNPATGIVNLAASTAGPHVVTYTSAGLCPASATFALTINPLAVSALTYSQAVYCRTGFTPAPTVSPAGGIFTGTPGLVINATTGVVTLASSVPGAHVVTYTSPGPCPTTAPFPLTILSVDVVAVTYAQTTYCGTGSTAAPVVSPAGGTFSGLPGLVLNPTTGVVNLGASTPGTYTVTYTSVGTCAMTATFTFRVDPADVASLGYPAASFCRAGTTAAPTFSPAGGTFSGSPGLVVNPLTGVIDLGASVPGGHVVTYSSAGVCPAGASFGVVIAPLDVVAVRLPDSVFCQAGTTPPPTVLPAGGQFSGTTGLVFDPATGIVDLARSSIRAHVLTYTTAGACPVSGTLRLRIAARRPAAVAYADSAFCPQGTTPAPVTQPRGSGIFTGSAGLVLDERTGIVNLATSTPGPHVVTFTSDDRCRDPATARFTIGVAFRPELPNVVTPNGDGLNEAFGLPASRPAVSAYELLIFNRWGARVYRTTDAAAPWAASGAGPGTYYYLLRFADCAGRAQQYKGWVEVVK